MVFSQEVSIFTSKYQVDSKVLKCSILVWPIQTQNPRGKERLFEPPKYQDIFLILHFLVLMAGLGFVEAWASFYGSFMMLHKIQ